MAISTLDMIDQELQRAATAPKSGNKKPLFLYFNEEGRKALIRPLYNLTDCIVLPAHHKWAPDREQRVNAICASAEGNACFHCAKVEQTNDKKLKAQTYFYLPVYVYGVKNAKDQTVNETVKDENGNETEQPIKGVRLLELASFGAVSHILKSFRDYLKEEDYKDIRRFDITVTQVGTGQQKSFTCTPKVPRPMDPRLKEIIPTPDTLRASILEALPPFVQDGSVTGGHVDTSHGAIDDDNDF